MTDQARRRIERDVHDGAQQRLVALRIKLALESERLEHEAPETSAELELLGAEVDETIEEVRAIAHGIYPSVLSDRGLVEALRAAARSTPLSCTVQDDGIGRHSQEIESAVYFACVGALANVGRDATRIMITLWADERLRFEVRDDDPGAAASGSRTGAGWMSRSTAWPRSQGSSRSRRCPARAPASRAACRCADRSEAWVRPCVPASPNRVACALVGLAARRRCWARPNGPAS